MKHIVEFRTLTLKPQTRKDFHHLFVERSLPLLQRWNFDVVAHGPSLHDENTYYVIRRFDSITQREQLEDAFYSSADWRQGPREPMLSLIDNYADIVLSLDEGAVERLRNLRQDGSTEV
jgi:hypothetical protein